MDYSDCPLQTVICYTEVPYKAGLTVYLHCIKKIDNLYYITIKKRLKIPKGGNQNLYIEEEQTTHWPKERVQKDKQRSTKHTQKTLFSHANIF